MLLPEIPTRVIQDKSQSRVISRALLTPEVGDHRCRGRAPRHERYAPSMAARIHTARGRTTRGTNYRKRSVELRQHMVMSTRGRVILHQLPWPRGHLAIDPPLSQTLRVVAVQHGASTRKATLVRTENARFTELVVLGPAPEPSAPHARYLIRQISPVKRTTPTACWHTAPSPSGLVTHPRLRKVPL